MLSERAMRPRRSFQARNRLLNLLIDRKTDRPDDRNNSYSAGRKDSLDEKILSLIRERRGITVPEIAAITGRPDVTVCRHIMALAYAGKVRRAGARKNGSWEIAG